MLADNLGASVLGIKLAGKDVIRLMEKLLEKKKKF